MDLLPAKVKFHNLFISDAPSVVISGTLSSFLTACLYMDLEDNYSWKTDGLKVGTDHHLNA